MVWRYKVVEMSRCDLDETSERMRELGLERWELLSVIPGSATDPNDATRVLCYFRRDASIEIGF